MKNKDTTMFEHFIMAQQSTYQTVTSELSLGAKCSHWIWYIFPQINGLAQSETAKFYALATKEQALAYYNHPILGKRLIECTELMLAINDKSLEQIMPFPDNLKFISSMTLFNKAVNQTQLFAKALEKFNAGKQDQLTLDFHWPNQ